jgi:hypothetical protein
LPHVVKHYIIYHVRHNAPRGCSSHVKCGHRPLHTRSGYNLLPRIYKWWCAHECKRYHTPPRHWMQSDLKGGLLTGSLVQKRKVKECKRQADIQPRLSVTSCLGCAVQSACCFSTGINSNPNTNRTLVFCSSFASFSVGPEQYSSIITDTWKRYSALISQVAVAARHDYQARNPSILIFIRSPWPP